MTEIEYLERIVELLEWLRIIGFVLIGFASAMCAEILDRVLAKR